MDERGGGVERGKSDMVGKRRYCREGEMNRGQNRDILVSKDLFLVAPADLSIVAS